MIITHFIMEILMKTIAISAIVGLLLGGVVIWFGVYNVAAKDKHLLATISFLEIVRERSINVRANDIQVPDLTNENLIKEGAAHYAEMCTQCHLAPGLDESELHSGLYPQPPIFTDKEYNNTPQSQFWVIKNGLKMTGMPAWSPAHTDDQIWGMVAFLVKIKELSVEEYVALSRQTGEGHSHSGSHSTEGVENEHKDDGHSH
jgi:mono/diheme cytochrome c family protein